jgi:hypothetical protein
MEKYKYEKDWCIKITSANKDLVREYLKECKEKAYSADKYIGGFKWTIGTYYGIIYDGKPYGSTIQTNVSRNIISDEEFLKMVQRTEVVDNYEMY